MNLYNNKITYRINMYLRKMFILPKIRAKIKNKNVSIICNNCNAGIILHDLNLKFNTPTVNMYFEGTDFFEFVENLEYYLEQELNLIETKFLDSKTSYPICKLSGNGERKDLTLHFLHYNDFAIAEEKWESRKKRIDKDNLFVMWIFMGEIDENGNSFYYDRVNKLPCKSKVVFVNHAIDTKKYPDFVYIKGFETQKGLGVLSVFSGLNGKRYYDQFDYVSWLNAKGE